MSIRKFLRKLFKMQYLVLNSVLASEGGFIFNWEPIWIYAGHLSNNDQRILGKLISEYVNGYTCTVHNEYGFMKCAVKAFEQMKQPYSQDEFDALMNLY